MKGKLQCYIKYLILSIIILTVSDRLLLSQVSDLGGTINSYAHVDAIGIGSVTINDNTQFSYFHAGDTVLLIQMKGVECLVSEDSYYGDQQINEGTPGAYEFLTVVSASSNIVTFKNYIKNSYNVSGQVQLVKVVSRNTVNIKNELNCSPWDSASKTGGVLALIVNTKITLNANINVNGLGFTGGGAYVGLGDCSANSGNNKYSYSDSWQNSGHKGESQTTKAYLSSSVQYPIYPAYAKGLGHNFSGGGGGNGRYAGGGGGGLVGVGGKGGYENSTCSNPDQAVGLGGKSISSTLSSTGLFLGSGGGGSTAASGATLSSGGNGGGIIIILCQTLDGNNFTISAEGAGALPVITGLAGSGGGGAGGTIALYLSSFSSNNLNLSVKGGPGGINSNAFGEGGGGGGGRLTISNVSIPSNVQPYISGGSYGTKSPSGHNATSGGNGESNTSFTPTLNGFLFNSVYSSVTKTQVDTICSDTYPPQLAGTSPVGGTSPYTYLWESSTTSESSGFTQAPGTFDQATYTPPDSLSQTTWYRRTVTDASGVPIVDVSRSVKMVVLQSIRGNQVGRDTTICYSQNPKKLYPINTISNGNGHYKYQWLSNTDNTTWTTNASGTSNLSSYDPDALTATTYYRRKVSSGVCVKTSPTVTITVLPSVSNNTITSPDMVICQGKLFDPITASSPSGGSGSYLYQWQDSISVSKWNSATGTNNSMNYTADTSDFTSTENRYYRRVVYSGLNNTCSSKSTQILLTRHFKIQNNNVAPLSQAVCAGNAYLTTLSGSSPTGGNGSYNYQWQDSIRKSSWTPTWTTQSGGTPTSLNDSTWFRRIVTSTDGKCTSNSNIIVVNAHKPISTNTISFVSGSDPATICNGSVPPNISGSVPTGGTNIAGDYAYLWQYSSDGVNFNDIASATAKDFSPPALGSTIYYRRHVISGMCAGNSNVVRVIVLPSITGNVIKAPNTAVCYNTVATISTDPLAPLAGGDGSFGYLWETSTTSASSGFSAAPGTNSQVSYTPPAGLVIKTWFRRTVTSGPSNCCTSTSAAISLDINPLPTGIITSTADTALCSGSNGTVKLRVTLTGAPNWTVVYNENSSQVTASGITSANAIISRAAAVTGNMQTFNYSLASVTDGNGCVATSLSGSRKADVYKTPVANAGPDAKICGRNYTLAALPSVGTGLWTLPARAHTSNTALHNAVVSIDTFNTANDTITFFWKETNWNCTSSDGVKITFDNSPDNVSAQIISPDVTFDNYIEVQGSKLMSFESGTWSCNDPDVTIDDVNAESTFMRNVKIGPNIFRWTVKNGTCSVSASVTGNVSLPVIPGGISPNGDGINDSLNVSGIDLVNNDADIKIFNSAGTMVFQSVHKKGNTGDWTWWNGKDSKGNLLPEGTYYYLLTLRIYTPEGVHEPKKKGFIILNRVK